LFFGLIGFFAICGLRSMVRNNILAAIVAALLFTFSNGGIFDSPDWPVKFAMYAGIFAVLIFVLLRFGLVATMAAIFFLNSFNKITLGSDWKTWYAPSGLATLVLLLGIAVFAFWRSLGSRELFSEDVEQSA